MNSKHLQSGAAAIEFALLTPYLLALLLATIEFGRMYYTYQRVEIAAFDSARYISTRLPSSGIFNLDDLKSATNNELRRRAKFAAVYGIGMNTGKPVLPALTTDHVTIDFDSLRSVDNADASTSRQSLCRVRASLQSYNILAFLVDAINNSRYCSEIDGNLQVHISYPYQPIFNEIPLFGIDLTFDMQAQASMRVF